MSGTNPVVTQRSALWRSVSVTALLSGGLLLVGAAGLWFWYGGSGGTAEIDPIEAKPPTVRRIQRPPEPVIEPTPASAPMVPRQFPRPEVLPIPPAAAAPAPINAGPMVTRYGGATPMPQQRQDGSAGVSPVAATGRGGVTYKQPPIEAQEATVITDLGRTLKPTTRIPCTLTQAIDGTYAGPLSCVISRPVLAWDNLTVLIPKDTPVSGNYQPLSTGQGRMMAMAATAWRSDGLAVPLGGSPMTDDLGRLGMNGYVDQRFWERVGNAILTDAALSAIKLPEAALRSQSRGIQFNTSDTEGVVNQVLSSTVNLPPIFHKNQGETIMILITAPVHAGALRYEVVR